MKFGHWLCVLAGCSVAVTFVAERFHDTPGHGPQPHEREFRLDHEARLRHAETVSEKPPARFAQPLVLWAIDDAWNVVPLAPDLVRRGRVIAMPWGWKP